MPFDATPEANRLIIVPAEARHVAALAPRLRTMDARECWALDVAPADGLERSLAGSLVAWTALEHGVPIVMWGVCCGSIIGGVGCPWMLGSDAMGRHRRQFLRECKDRLGPMRAMFPRMENMVLADYTASVRWLRWLGFQIDPAMPWGPRGELHHRFWMEV